jgi:hypothetical protein
LLDQALDACARGLDGCCFGSHSEKEAWERGGNVGCAGGKCKQAGGTGAAGRNGGRYGYDGRRKGLTQRRGGAEGSAAGNRWAAWEAVGKASRRVFIRRLTQIFTAELNGSF